MNSEPIGDNSMATREETLSGGVRLFDKITVIIAGTALLAMMTMTLLDVMGRYFLNAPLGFAFEMTQIGMAVVVFCALPSVTLHGKHVTAGLFDSFFKGKWLLYRDLLWLAVIATTCLALAWKLSALAERFVRYGDRTSVLELPVGWIAWLAVVMLCLSALAAGLAAGTRIRKNSQT